MGVFVRSITDKSEPLVSPRRLLWKSSRLRRVCASRVMKDSVEYVERPSIWARAPFWVLSRYSRMAPAALTASGSLSQP
jgi:hypothetical protein